MSSSFKHYWFVSTSNPIHLIHKMKIVVLRVDACATFFFSIWVSISGNWFVRKHNKETFDDLKNIAIFFSSLDIGRKNLTHKLPKYFGKKTQSLEKTFILSRSSLGFAHFSNIRETWLLLKMDLQKGGFWKMSYYQ